MKNKSETHPIVGIILILIVPVPLIYAGYKILNGTYSIYQDIITYLLFIIPSIYITIRIINTIMNYQQNKK